MSINSVTFSGNLTKDAEMKSTASGTSILEGRFAVNNREKHGDEWKDVPMFLNFTVFGTRGEKIAQYLTKGTKVTVTGRLKIEEWERDGVSHVKVGVIANDIDFKRESDSRSKARSNDIYSASDIPF